MISYNPYADGDVVRVDARRGGPMIWKIGTEDPARARAAERYLESQGYRFGRYDRGDGCQVEGWKFQLEWLPKAEVYAS